MREVQVLKHVTSGIQRELLFTASMAAGADKHDWTGLLALERLTRALIDVSMGTMGRETDWRGQQASLAFAKVSVTCMTFLRLIPGSSYYGPANQWAVWDLSAAASQARNLIEAYHLLCYLVHEPQEEPKKQFRQLLWEYHEEFERHAMLQAAVPDSRNLPQVAQEVAARQARLEGSPIFQALSPGNRQRLLEGRDFKLDGPIELSRKAGVSEYYYRSNYKYCSAFAHSAPFSISQLDAFKAGSPKAKEVMGTLVSLAAGYAALAIRDFATLFPDQLVALDEKTKDAIAFWESLLQWEKSPHFKGTASNGPEGPDKSV